MKKVLIVDDDKTIRAALSENLSAMGFSPVAVSGGGEAIKRIVHERPDSVLLDLKMPGMSGIEVLEKLRQLEQDVPVIVLTAFHDVPSTVAAMKLGACDFLLKPADFKLLALTLNKAMEMYAVRSKAPMEKALETLVGKSGIMCEIVAKVSQVALTDLSVLIEGETGTGKTFIAREIHTLSKRVCGPFISLDIGAIPGTLIESELFGYERGAFTGADKKRAGYFQAADRGTLFIDELQNMPSHVQCKLLSAVEEKRFYPLGGERAIESDIRIIVASNVDLEQAVREKRFRGDLYFRLSEFTIKLPPLRERGEDIAFLAGVFLKKASAELGKHIPSLDEKAVNFLMKQPWHGNVRELKNVMRRAVLFCDKDAVTLDVVRRAVLKAGMHAGTAGPALPADSPVLSMSAAEELAIRLALKHTGGNKTKAAEILRITLKTLLKKIKQYSI